MSEVEFDSRNKGESSVVSGSFMLPLSFQGDNLGAQITTVKLDRTIYLEWSQSATMHIGGRGN